MLNENGGFDGRDMSDGSFAKARDRQDRTRGCFRHPFGRIAEKTIIPSGSAFGSQHHQIDAALLRGLVDLIIRDTPHLAHGRCHSFACNLFLHLIELQTHILVNLLRGRDVGRSQWYPHRALQDMQKVHARIPCYGKRGRILLSSCGTIEKSVVKKIRVVN